MTRPRGKMHFRRKLSCRQLFKAGRQTTVAAVRKKKTHSNQGTMKWDFSSPSPAPYSDLTLEVFIVTKGLRHCQLDGVKLATMVTTGHRPTTGLLLLLSAPLLLHLLLLHQQCGRVKTQRDRVQGFFLQLLLVLPTSIAILIIQPT